MGEKWAQYRTALTAGLATCSCGIQFSWSSPAFSKIEKGELEFTLSIDDASWIIAIVNFSAILGSILSGALVDQIGRKLCILLANVPFLISWVLIYFANSAAYLYAARLISGIGLGMSLSMVPMYLGEIASTEMRGALTALPMFMINMGVLIEYSVGPYLSFHNLAIVSAVVPVLCLVLFFNMPESPYHLVSKGEIERAKTCLKRLRGSRSPQCIEEEVSRISKTVNEQQSDNQLSFREVLHSRANRKALLTVMFLALMQQMTGISSILAYFESMYQLSTPPFPLEAAYILLAVLQTVSCAGSSFVVDRSGRRPLLTAGSLLLGILYAAIAVFFLCKDSFSVNLSSASFVPVLLVMLVIIVFNIGQGPVIYVLIGEMLGQNVKALGATLAGTLISIGAFTCTKIYPIMVDSIGSYSPFLLFSVLSLVTAVFVMCAVPETKGKTFEQIQNMLSNVKNDYSKCDANAEIYKF